MATDTFEGVALTDLPTYNASWATSSGGRTAEISSDGHSIQATVDDGAPSANYYNTTVADKHYSQATLVGSPTGDSGVTIRHQSGANSFFYAIFSSSSSEVFVGENIAGTLTDWAGGANVAGFTGGDVLKLAVDATTATTINLIRIRASTPTTIATFTSKNALSGGNYGVCSFNQSIATFTDWEGGDVAGGGGSTVRKNLLLGVG